MVPSKLCLCTPREGIVRQHVDPVGGSVSDKSIVSLVPPLQRVLGRSYQTRVCVTTFEQH